MLNPNIPELKRRQPQLAGLKFAEEHSSEGYLPVHILLGVQDYQRIRTPKLPIFGRNLKTDPGAEYTKLGWVLIGGNIDDQANKLCYLSLTGPEQFAQLCQTDVLGLEEPAKEGNFNHEEFKNQIQMIDGHYQTKLPWKPDHTKLHSNQSISKARLESTTKKLEKIRKLEEYDEIMKDQLKSGILQLVPKETKAETVHYIPHHPVIKDEAETTKMRIVYDCSARENQQSPSLNDCLETGPPLQPHLFDVLLRNRFKRYVITGDIEKAFHQIHLHPDDRDVQRVLWYDNLHDRKVLEYQFTRIIFGATSSPYILGATLEKHLERYGEHSVHKPSSH